MSWRSALAGGLVLAQAQLANPAAVFCVERGGTHVIRDTPQGQVGYCRLPDGREVEAWAFFRANNPTPPASPAPR